MRKIKTLEAGFLVRRVLRALGKNSGFELPMCSSEKQSGVSEYYPHYSLQNELKNAILEVKILRAKGLEYHRHNMVR